MRRAVFTGLFACLLLTALSSRPVSAQPLDILSTNYLNETDMTVLAAAELQPDEPDPPAHESAPSPVPTIHTVVPNENLSMIAEQHQTTWVRLFNKNPQVSHPDVIKTGDQLVVPLPDEPLPERPLPEPSVSSNSSAQPAQAVDRSTPRREAPAPSRTGSSAGNRYTPGYCTWYAKNMRPDLPNNLGNAQTWVSRAAAQGLLTGSTPRPGAIGQQGNHVVYVQSVNGDGTVNISEMNYRGLYQITTRTVAASTFRYIY